MRSVRASVDFADNLLGYILHHLHLYRNLQLESMREEDVQQGLTA